MKRFINKKAVALGLAAGLALGVTGVALAYWTQGGSGVGTASTGTTTAVTVNQTSTAAVLYPGGPVETLSGDFDNPNSGAVKVGTVTAVLDTANLPSGCVAADFTVGGSAPVNAEIASGTSVGAWSGVTIQMNDTADNQNGCKSQSDIPLILTVSAAA